MKLQLILITTLIPFVSFLQKTGVLVLSGDADYYGYNKSEFVVYYNDEVLGRFDTNGHFNCPHDQKGPLIIKHPDFETIVQNDLKFSKKVSFKPIFEKITPQTLKKILEEFKSEQLSTCTGTKKEDLMKSGIRKIDSEAYFPGDSAGHNLLVKFISEHLIYPQKAVEIGAEGKVFISFVVEADGSITCIEVQKGVEYILDKEAFRFIKTLPKFVPATSNGVAVPIIYLLPLSFRLT
ncbi:energy transducer TonB [Fluviicola sp.]|uniref:energy transducer TonB n=1 Tax=Fluviicola sp. TaxID=1917219 RepID=UPI00260B5C07|nr:energy transducer TonB [Fluviicola sp.]